MKSLENSKPAIILGMVVPLAIALAVGLGRISPDMGIAAIGLLFSVALIPGVVENWRKKIGWSKRSTTMTAFGLFSMGLIFLSLGLTFTFASNMLAGSVWWILSMQAFMYAKPRPPFKLNLRLGTVDTAEEMEAVVRVLKHGHGEYYEERKDGCPTCEARDAILDRSVRDIGACDGCGME